MMMNVSQFAEKLGVSRTTIRRWIKEKKINERYVRYIPQDHKIMIIDHEPNPDPSGASDESTTSHKDKK